MIQPVTCIFWYVSFLLQTDEASKKAVKNDKFQTKVSLVVVFLQEYRSRTVNDIVLITLSGHVERSGYAAGGNIARWFQRTISCVSRRGMCGRQAATFTILFSLLAEVRKTRRKPSEG